MQATGGAVLMVSAHVVAAQPMPQPMVGDD
jgi:hypothetical protein